jgi:hypothetical protein
VTSEKKIIYSTFLVNVLGPSLFSIVLCVYLVCVSMLYTHTHKQCSTHTHTYTHTHILRVSRHTHTHTQTLTYTYTNTHIHRVSRPRALTNEEDLVGALRTSLQKCQVEIQVYVLR